MSADWALRTKGAPFTPPQKPGRTWARRRDRKIAALTPRRRRALARHRLALRVAAAAAEVTR